MTCRERLEKEHPKYVHGLYTGGCLGCPDQYGYLSKPEDCEKVAPFIEEKCSACWNREIPCND